MQNAEQQVVGVDLVMTEQTRFLLRSHQHSPSTSGESLEHAVIVALTCSLLDCRPRSVACLRALRRGELQPSRPYVDLQFFLANQGHFACRGTYVRVPFVHVRGAG